MAESTTPHVTSWRIYPRGGMYYADIYLDRPLPGTRVRRVQKSTNTRLDEGEGAARVQAQRMVDEIQRGTPTSAVTAGGALTVKGWCDRWNANRLTQGKLSAKDEGGHLRDHLYPWLGSRAIREVTKAEMLMWVRALPTHDRRDGRSGKISGRTCHNIANTVRHAFKHAAKEDVISVSPCVWDFTDLPDKEGTKDRLTGGFTVHEVAKLMRDARISEDRRMLYALEFLTGMRTGETAIRRWRDWKPDETPLGLLVADTSWSSRHHVEKKTKTRVTRWIPVHPELDRLLRAWKREGWARVFGRLPTPDDHIVPALGGGTRGWPAGAPRSNGRSWRLFQADLATVGLAAQAHYESRATFRSLALGGGADLHAVDLITHPSPKDAKDLYERRHLLWPRMCKAVRCIRIAPPSGEGLRLVK